GSKESGRGSRSPRSRSPRRDSRDRRFSGEERSRSRGRYEKRGRNDSRDRSRGRSDRWNGDRDRDRSRGRNGSRNRGSLRKCYNCQKYGHIARDCPEKEDDKENSMDDVKKIKDRNSELEKQIIELRAQK